jgi:integrase/recombinase XerD
MENGELLERYLRKRRKEKVANRTLKDDKDVLTQFNTFLNGREISECTVDEYIEYINSYTFLRKGKQTKYSKYTIYHIESGLKRFLEWVDPAYGDLVAPKMPKNRKLPKDMLQQQEVEKIIDACLTNRDRALISFIYESGVRKGELLSIRIENIIFDENGAVVTIPEGKTGPRRIRVVFSASFLRQWLDTHPKKDDKESFLFCSLAAPYGVLSHTGLRNQLNTLAQRAKIGKSVFPHLFRHSRATHLAKHLTEQEMKVYLGWSPGSSMAAVYVHLSGEDVDPAILKMNGIMIDNMHADSLTVRRCPRCKELNPETSMYCGKCGLPLKEEMRATIEKDSADADMLLMKLISKTPAFYEAITEEISKQLNNKN